MPRGEATAVRPGGAVTLQDVADAAGVSLATASRVINGSTRRVADSYRTRVQDAADRLGYLPNLSAQATARGTSSTVVLVVADIADPYFGQIAAGVSRAADEEGLVITIAVTGRDPAREVHVVHTLRGLRPRGVIFAASRTRAPEARALRAELDNITAAGGRVVTIGADVPGARNVPADNRGGARALGAAMTARGYRDAVILAAADGMRTSDERIAGFTDGFTTGGGTIRAVHRGEFSRQSGADMLRAAAGDDGLPDGVLVFAVSDIIALGALNALRDLGRVPGRSLGLAGFDDIPTTADVTPPLTTVRMPLEHIGHQALHAITDEQWTPDTGPGLDVLLRDSTPPRGAADVD